MHHLNPRNTVPVKVRPLRLLPSGVRRRVFHRLLIGHWPRLSRPAYYSEVALRELHREEGVMAEVAGDKDLCKTYVRGVTDAIATAPTRWLGQDVRDAPDDVFQGRWVAKFNAGSGMAVRGEGLSDREELARISRGWTTDAAARTYGISYYRHARQAVIIEDHIEGLDGRPLELRFFCFGGRTELVQMFHFVGDERFELYLDREGSPVPVSRILNRVTHTPSGDIEARPEHYGRARDIAELLAGAFPHVRVDLFVAGGRVWFGELTPYAHGGFVRFTPDSFDQLLARRWLDALI